MSGWVIAVRELYERGPLPIGQFRPQYSGRIQRDISMDLQRAIRLGLVNSPGRGGRVARPYTLTPAGFAFAEGRLAPVVPPYQAKYRAGRPKGSRVVLRPTWLAALPKANEIKLNDNESRCTRCVMTMNARWAGAAC